MFAYCNNNPVNFSDPSGNAGIREAFGRFYENMVKPVTDTVERYIEEEVSGTVSLGSGGSVALGLCVSYSVAVVLDSAGNLGIVHTIGFGGGTPNMGAGYEITTTSAPSIDKLYGWSGSLGGSIGVWGEEMAFFSDEVTKEDYYSDTVSYGISLLPEFHGQMCYTFGDKDYINLFSLFDSLERLLM